MLQGKSQNTVEKKKLNNVAKVTIGCADKYQTDTHTHIVMLVN